MVNYQSWEETVPNHIKGDSLWKMEAYRLALFAADIGWLDVTKLAQDKRTLRLSDQLYRALGSVGANLAEGYSRSSSKDRARFYEYALGSARESRDWYYKARYLLSQDVTDHRLDYLTKVIRLLLTMVPQQRGHTLKETTPIYEIAPLLENVPLPYANSDMQ
ncbi:MAG: four helix bundle protein [Ardenticatenaceae bacterium]|nr:four helix bundle protein [Ardenticatenaceae bacterium]MCB8990369.1 four helix bundle protein [Ardenticatenaceae bacterium]MCB9005262.1 four helix bundle protein [Ardenticatenaceae bacterium]